ncbi:hypothetical protein K432DRAFT_300159 [Lepidopterella palustris CBS 459.81]|uniref:N-acetyltransferase domain-containing protein n=1 Tax=Lepidopterella palustris CBS 459.81 TaxID=1314670 RepID=A0A8E2E8N4_9PEZI|nr:hypothetical protein K432DRAFT_300159 [Lepidopterella palustris CBS 459.81]
MASTSPLNKTRPTPRIRPATLADKEAWVSANLAGYELDPSFQWRYPKRKEFPEDARKASGDVFEMALGISSITCVVAELPRIDDEEPGDTDWVVVAVAMWEWKDWEEVQIPASFSSPASGRRDMDPIRQKLFIETITAAEKQYFGHEWGKKRLVLADLAADPKYHRRGAGKALLQYGSPMGRYLYTHLGFKELGYVDCGIKGEEKRIRTWIMVWLPEGWSKESIVELT